MIVLSWLFVILKSLNPANWSNIFVAYDNMCRLYGLLAAKNLLPLSSPWDKAWISVNKIIDKLHIKNHKDNTCKEKYNPSGLKEEMPGANTMATEQTFVWLSRFKKILCPMPKIHHLFYLHRMVKHRNRYTVHCYKNKKKPLLPKACGMQNWCHWDHSCSHNYWYTMFFRKVSMHNLTGTLKLSSSGIPLPQLGVQV